MKVLSLFLCFVLFASELYSKDQDIGYSNLTQALTLPLIAKKASPKKQRKKLPPKKKDNPNIMSAALAAFPGLGIGHFAQLRLGKGLVFFYLDAMTYSMANVAVKDFKENSDPQYIRNTLYLLGAAGIKYLEIDDVLNYGVDVPKVEETVLESDDEETVIIKRKSISRKAKKRAKLIANRAAFLAALPGLGFGHFYEERYAKGLLFAFLIDPLAYGLLLASLGGLNDDSKGGNVSDGLVRLGFIAGFCALKAWQISDAHSYKDFGYKTARDTKNNDRLQLFPYFSTNNSKLNSGLALNFAY